MPEQKSESLFVHEPFVNHRAAPYKGACGSDYRCFKNVVVVVAILSLCNHKTISAEARGFGARG